jgi:alpha-glucosidase
MPWTASEEFGGFSVVEPWLPVPNEHRQRAVDMQEASPDSVLNACRQFLAFRRQHSALRAGSIRFVDASDDVLAFIREDENERVLAAFNLSEKPVSFPFDSPVAPFKGHGFSETSAAGRIELRAYGAFFGNLAD